MSQQLVQYNPQYNKENSNAYDQNINKPYFNGQQYNINLQTDVRKRQKFGKDNLEFNTVKNLIFNFIKDGIHNISFNNLTSLIQRMLRFTPELNVNSGQLLKMSKSQLEDIVLDYGKKLSQMKYNDQGKNKQISEKIEFLQQVWESKFLDYYKEQVQNFKFINDFVNLTELQTNVQFFKEAFIKLDLFQLIIYNKLKKRFEFILCCDKSGKYGKKLNLKLFNDIIKVKTGISTNNTGDNAMYNGEKLGVLMRKNGQKIGNLTPDVTLSKEFKLVKNILKQQQLQKKTANFKKQIKRDVKDTLVNKKFVLNSLVKTTKSLINNQLSNNKGKKLLQRNLNYNEFGDQQVYQQFDNLRDDKDPVKLNKITFNTKEVQIAKKDEKLANKIAQKYGKGIDTQTKQYTTKQQNNDEVINKIKGIFNLQ